MAHGSEQRMSRSWEVRRDPVSKIEREKDETVNLASMTRSPVSGLRPNCGGGKESSRSAETFKGGG